MGVNRVEGSFAQGIRRGKKLLPGALRRLTNDVSDRMVRNTRRFTPIDTGRLYESIEPIKATRFGTRSYRGGAKSDLLRASFTEYDTAPHQIPNIVGVKKLVFYIDGRKIVTDKVNHPGTTGAHMFAKGSAMTEKQLQAISRKALNDWKLKSGL